MMTSYSRYILLFLLVTLGFTLTSPAQIMPLKEVKIGMEGTGRTIFKGSQIESFQFKVLGVIEKFAPNKNLIIVELISPQLEDGGVISGMSGSPLYIDGKNIGAVAYGFSFAKKPIAGVTPIEDIIKVSQYNQPIFTVDISDIKIDFSKKNVETIKQLIRREMVARASFNPSQNFSPIKLLASSRGFSSEARAFLNPLFSHINSVSMGQIKLSDQNPAGKRVTIQEADAAAVPLVKGDFEYSASGTVSHIDGDKIYLFGHPYFNLGRVDFPLHKAEIISVVPSYDTSFKLAATGEMVGRIVQDRFSAIQGELGASAYMIPVNIFMTNRSESYKLEMIHHPLLTPSLIYISLLNVFQSLYQDFGLQTLNVDGKIFIEGENNVLINDHFSGTTAFDEFAALVLSINFYLLNNKERHIKIQKMDFEIKASETIRRTELQSATIDKNSAKPGELINITLFLKNERGASIVEKSTIQTPNLTPGSDLYLLIGSAEEMIGFDSQNVDSGYFPSRLDILIRAINNIRRNNRIYFKLFTIADGLFVKGNELSSLPPGIMNILEYNTPSEERSNIKFSTLMEYQMPIPAVFSGRKVFKIKIKKR